MTPRQADKLIQSSQWINVTDTYGDTGEMKIISRASKWSVNFEYRNGRQGVIDRSDIKSWTPLS